MIIEENPPKRQDEASAPITTGEGSSEPPPPPAYSQHETDPLISTSPPVRHSPTRRFFEAFLVAVAIYFLFVMLTSSMRWAVRGPDRRGEYGWPINDGRGWPDLSDGPAVRCVGGDNWNSISPQLPSSYPRASQTTFQLPIDSKTIYFLARGNRSEGLIQFESSEEPRDHVEVDVIAEYSNRETLDRANICHLQRADGDNGIGIFTPRKWKDQIHEENMLLFRIRVRYPLRRGPLHGQNLETNLPNFFHQVRDLVNTVDFGFVSLKTVSMPMTIGSIFAEHAYLSTTYGSITGSFHMSGSLEIQNRGGIIAANISLYNNPHVNATTVMLNTTNAPIHSVLTLASTHDTGGSFNVTTQTSYSPLDLEYVWSPLNSTLYHEAFNVMGPVNMQLHRAYEGSYSLETSANSPKPIVEVTRGDMIDPSGQGRGRQLEVFKKGGNGNSVSGFVHWGKEEVREELGAVRIRSTGAPVTLQL